METHYYNIQEVTTISRTILVLLGACGIVPLHSLAKRELFTKTIQILHIVALFAFGGALKVYLVLEMRGRPESFHFSEVLEFVAAQLAWTVTLVQSYNNRALWLNLINSLLRHHPFSATCDNNNWSLIKIFKCRLFYVALFSIGIQITHILSSLVLCPIYVVEHQINSLVRNLICLRVIVLVYFFEQRYKHLTKMLHSINEREPMRTLHSARKYYIELEDLMQDFNHLNGYQLLLVIAFSSLLLINTAINSATHSISNDVIFLPSVVMAYLGTIMNLFYMMDCCNAVDQASEELLRTSSEVESHFCIFSEQFLELKSLSKFIYFHRTKISAAHYFDINRLTVFYFLYNTSTYFVVLVQFYSRKTEPNAVAEWIV